MDHYAVLGVSKTATPDEIKKAYRKLASQHHPDKGGNTTKFQEIQTAYDTLSDSEKRQQYDNPQPQGFHMGPGGFQFNMGPGMDMNDIFGQIFNNNAFGQRRNQRQLMRTQIKISLLDAYNGSSQTLKLNTAQGQKIVNVEIPKGIQSGQQVRLDNIFTNATLLVEFVVMPHLSYDREGDNLYSNHSISVLDLIAGTKFDFMTISGRVLNVNVPAKTQPFMQLKLTNQGMPIPNTMQYGDQLILLKPYIPDNISQDIVDSILRNKGN